MVFQTHSVSVSLGLTAMMALLSGGCGRSSDEAPVGTTETTQVEAEHDHSGWWCAEHGLPEEECSLCSAQAAAKFREQGDWCEDHNRAESQCFLCDPSRAEKFAKLYEAKFGEKPPERTQ